MSAEPGRIVATAPRVALSREEAAASLGMSVDHFERHVQPTIRMARVGRKVIVPVDELRRWVADRAELILP
jgi:hypothetical protein